METYQNQLLEAILTEPDGFLAIFQP